MRNYVNLSPIDFEELVRDLLQADMGIPFESFGPGADQGIDLRYSRSNTQIIVQAKRYIDTTFPQLLRSLQAERPKVEKLKPTRYILAIAQTLTKARKDKILEIFRGLPLALGDIKSLKEIDSLLTSFPKIEKAHFKLWLSSVSMLERIIFAGIYNRTRAEMAEIADLIPKFVGNSSIGEAEKILKKQRVLIISGEPGVGKSSLARFLVSSHAQQGWNIYVIDNIEKAFEVMTSDENTLVFFDDFLGQVELTPDFLRGMDAQLPTAFRDIQRRKNVRLILTTRSYILRHARYMAGRLADEDFKPTEFVLKIGHYSRAERARILYNHLYFSDIAKSYREELIDQRLVISIIDHRNFNPRLIKVLTSSRYVQLEETSVRETILRVLDNPEELWKLPYRQQLNVESRALLIALFVNPASTALADLSATFQRFLRYFGGNIPTTDMGHRFRQSLHELEGSFLSIGNGQVSFANPGVRDFLATVVWDDDLVKILLPAVRTYVELRSMWQSQRRRLISPKRRAEFQPLFLAAFKRCKGDESLDVLAQIDLGLQMHGVFNDTAVAKLVQKAVADIPNWQFDDKDIATVRSLTTALFNSSLTKTIIRDAEGQLLKAIESIVRNERAYFSLDDVRAIIGLLREFLALPDETSAAVKAFLERWIDEDFSSELDMVSDVDELDKLEEEIDELMIEFGARSHELSDLIAAKREALENEDADSDDDNSPYIPASNEKDVSISDREIKSMFDDLRTPSVVKRSRKSSN